MEKMENVPFRFISSRQILEARQDSQKVFLIISEDIKGIANQHWKADEGTRLSALWRSNHVVAKLL